MKKLTLSLLLLSSLGLKAESEVVNPEPACEPCSEVVPQPQKSMVEPTPELSEISMPEMMKPRDVEVPASLNCIDEACSSSEVRSVEPIEMPEEKVTTRDMTPMAEIKNVEVPAEPCVDDNCPAPAEETRVVEPASEVVETKEMPEAAPRDMEPMTEAKNVEVPAEPCVDDNCPAPAEEARVVEPAPEVAETKQASECEMTQTVDDMPEVMAQMANIITGFGKMILNPRDAANVESCMEKMLTGVLNLTAIVTRQMPNITKDQVAEIMTRMDAEFKKELADLCQHEAVKVQYEQTRRIMQRLLENA